MSQPKFSLSLLLLSHVVFLASVAVSFGQLPARMATHFDAAGLANDWTSRESYCGLIVGLVLGLSAVMVGIFYSIRLFPVALVNIPRREYWLAAERKEESYAALFGLGIWLSILETWFLTGLHWLTVQANAAQPAKLSNAVWVLACAMLVAVGIWIFCLIRRFGPIPVEPALQSKSAI